MTHSISPPGGQIASLDVIRGAAILMVLFGHYVPQAFSGVSMGLISSWSVAGVLVFFSLSGFLIHRNIQTQPVAIFLTRRFFRILPAYWVNVLAIAAAAAAFGTAPDVLGLVSNFFLIQEFTHTSLFNDVYWTLQIEVKFYIIMALFCTLAGAKRIYWLLAALLLVNMAVFPVLGRGSTLITYLITFFPGVAAARAHEGGWTMQCKRELAIVTALTSANLALFLEQENMRQAVYILLTGGLLWFSLTHEFRSRIVMFFGKISYSVYLYHSVIGYAVIDMLGAGQGWEMKLAAIALAAVLSIAISTLSFYLIEQPGVKYGRKLEPWIGGLWQRAVASAGAIGKRKAL